MKKKIFLLTLIIISIFFISSCSTNDIKYKAQRFLYEIGMIDEIDELEEHTIKKTTSTTEKINNTTITTNNESTSSAISSSLTTKTTKNPNTETKKSTTTINPDEPRTSIITSNTTTRIITTNSESTSSIISNSVTTSDSKNYLSGAVEGTNEANVTLCEDGCVENIVYSDFEIHFIELGNEYTGDSTYIKAGDIDILIDAGSRQASAVEIIDYVNQYCTDGVLEYVISTHAHQDHIAGFVGNSGTTKTVNYFNEKVDRTGIFYYYKIGTIIEFARSDATSNLYKNYQTARDYAVANGAVCYTADNCFENISGASSHYELSDSLDISFDILYNKYYFESAVKTSGEENNYSVCTMFNYLDNHFLLTGDLEIEGEEAMAEYYDASTEEKTLPHVVLFKAGHHGSSTSSNSCLLSKITPDICCVCCCAGSTEYTPNYNNIFPTQAFIDRIKLYTDRVYVTTLFNEKTKNFESMNGDIIISSNGEYIGIYASNNITKLKDSTWFNEEIYVLYDSSKKVYNICPKLKSTDFYSINTEGAIKVVRRTW